MAATPQPDYAPESRIVEIPASALVEMRDRPSDFLDTTGVLGLGQNDLINLKLPKFQRGLKWNKEKLSNFHESLTQGWPIGVLVIAVQSSQILNSESDQRKHTLSLIDGQQRSWALVQLTRNFWTEPWIAFQNEKWETTGPASGSIFEAQNAVEELAEALGSTSAELQRLVSTVAQENGRGAFEDYVRFLGHMVDLGADQASAEMMESRGPARRLCDALLQQERALLELKIPALLIGQTLQSQLPTIFRRLNEGIPLKGYDLLAAMWESALLQKPGTTPTAKQRKFLEEVRAEAVDRIESTYTKAGPGYDQDPNADPISTGELSLFDFLYFLGQSMVAGRPMFNVTADVLAFQTAALTLRGSLSQVDDRLRGAFPLTDEGTPDVDMINGRFVEAAKNIEMALKPLMDVSFSTVTLKGKIGLTPTVVYLASFLTHHQIVKEKKGSQLEITSRGTSVADRQAGPGEFLTSTERLARLKANLPAWYVHDALTSTFAGANGYVSAQDRVWADFRSSKTSPGLVVSNVMLGQPPLVSLLRAFDELWKSECEVEQTPQRRRVSDAGSILFRAAFSHLPVHDVALDHVMAFTKCRNISAQVKEVFPINHVANLLPLSETLNNKRSDEQWSTYFPKLSKADQTVVKKALLVKPVVATDACTASQEALLDFLRVRYRAMVSQALKNLGLNEWSALSDTEKDAKLRSIAL